MTPDSNQHSELRTAIVEGLLHERPSFSAGLEALDSLFEQLTMAEGALRTAEQAMLVDQRHRREAEAKASGLLEQLEAERSERERLFRENLQLGEALALERSPSNPASEPQGAVGLVNYGNTPGTTDHGRVSNQDRSTE